MEAFVSLLAAVLFLFLVAWTTLPEKEAPGRTIAVDNLAAATGAGLAVLLLAALILLSLPLILKMVLLAFVLFGFSFALAVFYATRQEVLARQEYQRRQFFALNERIFDK